MSLIIKSGSSADLADVNSYKQLLIKPGDASVPASVGAIRLFSENDNGAVTGTPYISSPETSQDYRLRVGMDTILLTDTFNATIQNTSIWKHAFTTMTATQSSGFLNINAAGTSTVSGNYASMVTFRTFTLFGSAPLYAEQTSQITMLPVANEVIIFGLGVPGAGADPSDGVWFQLTSAGLIGVLKYNGAVTQTGILKAVGDITVNSNMKFNLTVGERSVEYWLDDVLLAEQLLPAANGSPFISVSLPYFMMKYNSALVGSSPNAIFKISNVTVSMADLNTQKLWSHQMAGMGLSAYQTQNGTAPAQTALYPNATAATTVTGAALAQGATLATGFGGQVGITATVPGVDGWVTAYLNPAGTVAITPRVIYITGVKISAINIGAAVAGTPTTISWSLGFGGTNIALTTADTGSFVTATAKANRRIPLGLSSWIIGAAIGAQVPDIYMAFNSPIVVNPGEYVGVIAKFIQGTATASQVIWATVTFDAYLE